MEVFFLLIFVCIISMSLIHVLMSLQHLTEPLSGHNFDMVVTLTSDVLAWDNRHDVIVQQTTVVASDELLTQGISMGETLDVEFSVGYN